MSEKSGPELWKVLGGGLIIAIAFLIMMPGVLDYVGRIGKVLLLVFIALGMALTAVLARHKIMGGKQAAKSAGASAGSSVAERQAES
jgi:hypothetical protein